MRHVDTTLAVLTLAALGTVSCADSRGALWFGP